MKLVLSRILWACATIALATGLPGSLVHGQSAEPSGGSITITGVVRHPGTYKIKGALTISKALELAGGIADAPYSGADGPPAPASAHIRVVRGNQTFVVNLGRKRTKEDESFEILPGDKIAVPEVLF